MKHVWQLFAMCALAVAVLAWAAGMVIEAELAMLGAILFAVLSVACKGGSD